MRAITAVDVLDFPRHQTIGDIGPPHPAIFVRNCHAQQAGLAHFAKKISGSVVRSDRRPDAWGQPVGGKAAAVSRIIRSSSVSWIVQQKGIGPGKRGALVRFRRHACLLVMMGPGLRGGHLIH